MSKAKIYTRFGDQGQTRLVDGSCVEKFNPRVRAYGTVDELNSALGVALTVIVATPELHSLQEPAVKIQNHLFRVGSLLACANPEISKKLPAVESLHVTFLENEIDQREAALPALTQFILPGGHSSSALLHVARTICRRAERCVAELDSSPKDVLIYLNRLSDWLFVAARWCNHQMKFPDSHWDKNL